MCVGRAARWMTKPLRVRVHLTIILIISVQHSHLDIHLAVSHLSGPQVLIGRFVSRFNISLNFWNAGVGSGFVNPSAGISLVGRYLMIICFLATTCLIQCQRTSMCLVLLWNKGLVVRSIAPMLFAWINIGLSAFV